MAPLRVVTLCTGNAARSVMAGMMLSQLAEFDGLSVNVVSAGTHVIEGQPMGQRTRLALESLGDVDLSGVSRHRSHQLTESDVAAADVILAMEADHVRYVRRIHSEAAGKTVTMHRLVREITVDPVPFPLRLAALSLGSVNLDDEIDVIDPAGGEQSDYDACAKELWDLSQVTLAIMMTEP